MVHAILPVLRENEVDLGSAWTNKSQPVFEKEQKEGSKERKEGGERMKEKKVS